MKNVTYGQFVCMLRPEEAKKTRTQLMVGGNHINYPGQVATSTAGMLLAKLLFNSIVSTKSAQFMAMDISNFYLMTPLSRPKYIHIKLSDNPDEIIKDNLLEKATKDGSIYIEANKGMYCLPHAGLLDQSWRDSRLFKGPPLDS